MTFVSINFIANLIKKIGFFDNSKSEYHSLSIANHDDPGEPLSPPHSGWLIKTKDVILQKLFNKIYKSIYGLDYNEDLENLHLKFNKRYLNLNDTFLNSLSKVANTTLDNLKNYPIHSIELHDISSI